MRNCHGYQHVSNANLTLELYESKMGEEFIQVSGCILKERNSKEVGEFCCNILAWLGLLDQALGAEVV